MEWRKHDRRANLPKPPPHGDGLTKGKGLPSPTRLPLTSARLAKQDRQRKTESRTYPLRDSGRSAEREVTILDDATLCISSPFSCMLRPENRLSNNRNTRLCIH